MKHKKKNLSKVDERKRFFCHLKCFVTAEWNHTVLMLTLHYITQYKKIKIE